MNQPVQGLIDTRVVEREKVVDGGSTITQSDKKARLGGVAVLGFMHFVSCCARHLLISSIAKERIV